MTFRSRGGSARIASRTRLATSPCSHSRSGLGSSGGTRTGGRFAWRTVSPEASGDVDSIALMRTMVRLRLASSDPMCFARSARDGSDPISWRSFSRAASSSRRTLRTPRGQASRRMASIIAPRTRRSAKVSNLMPRRSSKRCAASIRPIMPSCTRSPTSIECGREAAIRRAIASTNGTPAAMRSWSLGPDACALMMVASETSGPGAARCGRWRNPGRRTAS